VPSRRCVQDVDSKPPPMTECESESPSTPMIGVGRIAYSVKRMIAIVPAAIQRLIFLPILNSQPRSVVVLRPSGQVVGAKIAALTQGLVHSFSEPPVRLHCGAKQTKEATNT
jgi:hypothetical protein